MKNLRITDLIICYYSYPIVDIEFIMLLRDIQLYKYASLSSVVIFNRYSMHVICVLIKNIINVSIFYLIKESM